MARSSTPRNINETSETPEIALVPPEVLRKILTIFRQIWTNFENDTGKKILPDGQALRFDLGDYRVEYKPDVSGKESGELTIQSQDGNSYNASSRLSHSMISIPIQVAGNVLKDFYENWDLLTPTGQFWVFKDGNVVRDLSSKLYGKPASLEAKKSIVNKYVGPFVPRIKSIKSVDDVVSLSNDLQTLRGELLREMDHIGLTLEEVNYLIYSIANAIAGMVSRKLSAQVYGKPISKDQDSCPLASNISAIIIALFLTERINEITGTMKKDIDNIRAQYKKEIAKTERTQRALRNNVVYWRRWAFALGTIAALGVTYAGFDIASHHFSDEKQDTDTTVTYIPPTPTPPPVDTEKNTTETTKPSTTIPVVKPRDYQETPTDRARYIDSICDTDDDSTNNGTIRRITKTQCEGPVVKTLRDAQRVIQVPYTDYTGVGKTGYIVVHRDVVESTRQVFEQLQATGFRIQSVMPVSEFDWKDSLSMTADNSSGFNPRCSGVDNYTTDCTLSRHSYGQAIDLNPVENPFHTNGRILPTGATYKTSAVGTVTVQIADLMKNNGWKTWGGNWNGKEDYQHFEHE